MNEKNIGALWIKTSKNGERFHSGVVEIDGVKHNIVVFKNNHKTEEKHPDYRIFLSTPREDRESMPQHGDDVPF